MKIIALNGSARKTGYTAQMISALLEAAASAGAETVSYDLAALDIGNCLGCGACKKLGQGCVVRDGMQDLYDEIAAADAVVLGTPIYFRQMSGQCKTFLDRMYACYGANKRSLGKKKMVFLVSQGYKDPDFYRPYIDNSCNVFSYFDFDLIETLLCYGTNADNCNIKEALLRAGELGALLGQENNQ